MASKHVAEVSRLTSGQYRQLIDSCPVAVGVACNDSIVFINSAGARLMGSGDSDRIVGKKITDLIHGDNRDLVAGYFRQVEMSKDEGPPIEAKVRRFDGNFVDVEIAATWVGYKGTPAVQFAFRDITKRKQIEGLLVQSKQDWEDTFHAITDMITVHDRDFNIIYANRAAMELLNLPALQGMGGNKCFQYYHGTDCPPVGCPSCDCLRTGEPANFEIFEPHLNMYIEIRSMPRYDSSNQLIGLIHIARDVTDRKRSERALQEAKGELERRVEERTRELLVINEQLKEEFGERMAAVEALQQSEGKYRSLSQEFHALLNGIPDSLVLVSPGLKVMWANKAAAAVSGNNAEDLKGQYCFSACYQSTSPCDNCPTQRSFASGKEETAEISSRTDRIWDIRAFPILDDEGHVKSVMELARDITEKSNLEAGATRTRHLASLGELAAGVAHEINNPINNIINYAQILVDEFHSEKRDDEIAKRIIRDGNRIATIVRSLLSFARIRKEEKSVMYLHEIFSDTLSLTSAQIRKDGIHLKVDIPSQSIKVPVHPQQIQQVFLNLISNSRYALNYKYPGTHENKILSITCEETLIDNEPHILMTFLDRGTGIPAAIIDKVMNPFFSTKANRVGTGLGLSISHGIISEHGGKLLISSLEGEYTKITINLPINIQGNE
ncbi:MAG: PAS domain S-box protein [Nitrospiraceae bacterium]|nr:MAG: PAS domain S-box protein [Nitrospiraceae bacterium]